MERFVCHRRSAVNERLPAFGPDALDAFDAIPEAERDERVGMNEELCVIDGTDHFIRACLEILVHIDDAD